MMNEKIPGTRWLRIIAPVLIACIISFMDRVNISFALPGGMESDLGITSQMAGVASGIFFIGYLFLQIPGGRIAVHGSGKRFIAWSLLAWAIVSIATGFVTHEYQLLALRFILGVSEGGQSSGAEQWGKDQSEVASFHGDQVLYRLRWDQINDDR
jgi:MFS family permease